MPEVDLVDIIIDGLNDKSGYVSMLYGARSIRELKEALIRYEKKLRDVAPVSVRTVAPVNTVGQTGTKPKQMRMTTEGRASTGASASSNTNASGSGIDMSTIRCYNCFQYGHYQSSCLAPKRPPNSCFTCFEVGHTRHECPNRKPKSNPSATPVALTMNGESWDTDEDEAEVRSLAKQLASSIIDAKQNVSVAFFDIEQNKCTEVMKRIALFDSGSPASFVRKSWVPFMQNKTSLTSYRGLGNKKLSTYGTVKCKFEYRKRKLTHDFIVLSDEEAVVPLIVGRDLMTRLNVHLCDVGKNQYSTGELIEIGNKMKNKNKKPNDISALRLFNLFRCPLDEGGDVPMTGVGNIKTRETGASGIKVNSELCVGLIDFDNSDDVKGLDEVIVLVSTDETDESGPVINVSGQLNETDANALRSIIRGRYLDKMKEKSVFSGYSMKIKLTNDTPVYSSPRRLSYAEKQEVQKTINELLAQSIIRPSNSPYASPIVLVRKRDGKLRMCVDYRALNKITVRDHFPLPIIEDTLEYLGGKRYFTTLDLKNGFHHVPMHDDSIPLTAFVTPMGQYEYCYMPFGLTDAPPCFQRFINRVLQKMIESNELVVYMDDISIATVTVEEHKRILGEALDLLSAAGLKLNLEKCKFAFREVDYLGYRVNESGIRPSERHWDAIKNFSNTQGRARGSEMFGTIFVFQAFCTEFF